MRPPLIQVPSAEPIHVQRPPSTAHYTVCGQFAKEKFMGCPLSGHAGQERRTDVSVAINTRRPRHALPRPRT